MEKELLLIFTRNAVLGKVKTRLAKSLGEKKALEIYQALLTYTHSVALSLQMAKYVFYDQNIVQQDLWSTGDFQKFMQQGEDLGQKMETAFKMGFQNGFGRIIIIGSDCAEITASIIDQAFQQLGDHDYVIGPAKDGGYYLLGMKKLYFEVFRNKSWSTSTVFYETIKDFNRSGMVGYELPILSDVDFEADLPSMDNLKYNTQKLV